MRFPLQVGSSTEGLQTERGQCVVCKMKGVGEPNGFAFINAGALLEIGKGVAMPSDQIKAFFSIGYHGDHSNKSDPSAMLEIVDEPASGQFEFYFCSTSCLRGFFNQCVDELENQLNYSG